MKDQEVIVRSNSDLPGMKEHVEQWKGLTGIVDSQYTSFDSKMCLESPTELVVATPFRPVNSNQSRLASPSKTKWGKHWMTHDSWTKVKLECDGQFHNFPTL